MVRKACKDDIASIIRLLHQVNMVHHVIRPDLFKPHTTKYDEQELEALLDDDTKPIFVYDDGQVLGHAFCQLTEVSGHKLLCDVKTLYIKKGMDTSKVAQTIRMWKHRNLIIEQANYYEQAAAQEI